MKTVERVYKNRDNTNDLLLKADGVAIDLSAITKMELIGDGWSVDSTTNPAVFDFSAGGGVVVLSLGGVEGMSAGKGWVDIIVYDSDNTNGVNWGSFPIYVEA
jgi:hypothetical protein